MESYFIPTADETKGEFTLSRYNLLVASLIAFAVTFVAGVAFDVYFGF